MGDGSVASGATHRATVSSPTGAAAIGTTFAVILSLSFCHLLNDLMQSLVPALYPILKGSYGLSFSQVGLITLAFQFTASMLQPVVGLYTDRHPRPYSLTVGIGLTLVGLLLMSRASTYPAILLAATLIGMGSAIFHPEASRVARMASGGRYGLAQSLFQVGGNIGRVGPFARRLCRRPPRAVEHCVVLRCGADRHLRTAADRELVRAAARPRNRARGPQQPPSCPPRRHARA